jgi:hypothetical protein
MTPYGNMTPEIVEKVRVGDGLSDAELNTALSFYGQLEAGLRLLGPRFHLAWAEVQRVLHMLESYKHNRDAYKSK